MLKIDSHNHFWMYNSIRDSWIDDERALLKRDFLPKDLELELKDTGQNGCIVVQSDSSELENFFQMENASHSHFIKGIIGWVDFQAKNIHERLDFYGHYPIIKGFRHILQSENLRDFMLQKDFLKGISLLEKKGFTYDILILEDQLGYAQTFIQKFPYQKFVLDHIGKPDIRHQKLEPWAKAIIKLANYPNVYCKLSGMITEAHWQEWKYEHIKPFMDIVLEAFGPKRVLWGSDWPVCLLAGSYKKTFELVNTYIQKLSPSEQGDIMGANALDFYSLI